MKTIIKDDTGEVIEVEEDNEIVTRKLYEVGAIDEYTMQFLTEFKEMEERYKYFRMMLEKAMIKNGIKSWKTDDFVATITDETTKKQVDIDRLKKDDLYHKYLELIPIKKHLTIKFRKEK